MLRITISRTDGTPKDYTEAEKALRYALSLLSDDMEVTEHMIQSGSDDKNLEKWNKQAIAAYILINSLKDAIEIKGQEV